MIATHTRYDLHGIKDSASFTPFVEQTASGMWRVLHGPSGTPRVPEQVAEPRAAELARRFERAHERFVRAFERDLDDRQAGSRDRGGSAVAEGWHVAEQYLSLADFIEALATGRTLPPLAGACVDGRKRPGGPGASGGKAGALALLRSNGDRAAAIIRGLGDEQLERSSSCFGTKLSAGQLVEELLISHIEEHRSGVRE
jgi:hypothetical protein